MKKNKHIQFWRKTNELIKKVFRHISKNNNLVTLLLTLVSLYVAYKSLELSDLSLKYSEKQNEINSITSDSLFKVQLLNSKNLNDSIINEINKLRSITDNQLHITEKQLIELKAQSKPRIALTKFWAPSYSIYDMMTEVSSELTFLNVGNREALKLQYISFIISSDLSKVSDLSKGAVTNRLNSGEEYNFDLSIKVRHKIHEENFYIYIRIYYFDSELNKTESNEYFYKKWDTSHRIDLIKCNVVDIDKLRKTIKEKNIFSR